MWCTSRTSPASTTMPTFMRVCLRMRWWCTAAIMRSDGMGARSRLESRSDSTMNCAPCAMARSTSSHMASMRRCMASGPSSTR